MQRNRAEGVGKKGGREGPPEAATLDRDLEAVRGGSEQRNDCCRRQGWFRRGSPFPLLPTSHTGAT